MKCLNNIKRTQLPNDIVMNYIKVYQSIGTNQENHNILNDDYETIVMQTIKNDIYYFAKIFQIDISNRRFKSLVFKDVKPKNKNEQLIKNLKNVFHKIHDDISTFQLLTNEIQDLMQFLYTDIIPKKNCQFRKLKNESPLTSLLHETFTNARDVLEKTVKLLNDHLENESYEASYLIVNFYIDFLHIKPFYDKNEEIGLLVLYILLLSNGYEVYEYVSFMKYIYTQRDVFNQVVLQSSFNYSEGLAQVLPLHRFLLKGANESYQTLRYLVRDYEFDKHLNKTNNIENTILKFEDVFSKEDLRQKHPFVSDSTINRTLRRLRDEGAIRPIGKGRSAKWMRLTKPKKKQFKFEQLDLKI
ncbi:MAG: hypothetical protein K9L26_02780 [Candidatus Izimaplasma sp.]|nr:hypothetical protein [Candidatus Izimaplasma bacterium]